MKKRLGIAVGGLAVMVAAAIPATSAFGCVHGISPHCQKVDNSLSTAGTLVGNTNSGQSTTVQAYLAGAAGKCG